jgi:hypothetical protein
MPWKHLTAEQTEHAKALNIDVDCYRARLRMGWSVEKAYSTPKRPGKKGKWKGLTVEQTEYAKSIGVKRSAYHSRLCEGWDVHKAYTTPVRQKSQNNSWKGLTAEQTKQAIEKGIDVYRYHSRLQRGYTPEQAMSKEVVRRKNNWKGLTEEQTKIAINKGISRDTFFNRVNKHGYTIEEAYTMPVGKRREIEEKPDYYADIILPVENMQKMGIPVPKKMWKRYQELTN